MKYISLKEQMLKERQKNAVLAAENAKIENALCDMDIATEERLAEIENALCDMDMGGDESE